MANGLQKGGLNKLSLPLEGVRVLDFTIAWAGPTATRILSYFGAEVIKIEAPGRLDSWRGPVAGGRPEHYVGAEHGEKPYDRHCWFNSVNHDKLSMGVDLKAPGAVGLVLKLAEHCDVVVANFSPGVLDRLGLGYAALRQVRPDIIVMEMPAYGNDGPVSRHVAMGLNMEGMAGMAVLQGYGDGIPTLTGTAFLDPAGGFHAAAAVMTALVYRQRTGEGQYIEVAQRDAALHWVGEQLLERHLTGYQLVPNGNDRPGTIVHDAFACKGEDEWVAIAVSTIEQWELLCALAGCDELAEQNPEDPHIVERLKLGITKWTKTQNKHVIASLLQERGVPAAPINNGRDLLESNFLMERGFFSHVEREDLGSHPYQGLPFGLSRTPGSIRNAAPRFGQHNEFVCKKVLGLSDEEVSRLIESGALAPEPIPHEL